MRADRMSSILERARLRNKIAVAEAKLATLSTRVASIAVQSERASLERQLAELRAELQAAERGVAFRCAATVIERVRPGSEDGERRVSQVKPVTPAQLRGEQK